MNGVAIGQEWEIPSAPALGRLKVKTWMYDETTEICRYVFGLWDNESELILSHKHLLQKAILVTEENK